jgi:hypothetical protein
MYVDTTACTNRPYFPSSHTRGCPLFLKPTTPVPSLLTVTRTSTASISWFLARFHFRQPKTTPNRVYNVPLLRITYSSLATRHWSSGHISTAVRQHRIIAMWSTSDNQRRDWGERTEQEGQSQGLGVVLQERNSTFTPVQLIFKSS